MKKLIALMGALAMAFTLAAPQAAHATVTVTASHAGTKIVGHQTNTWGTVSEPGARQVWTEVMLASGSWSRSQVRTTDDNGYFVIPLTYGTNIVGDTTYRVGAETSEGVVFSEPFALNRTSWSVGNAGQKNVGERTNTWGTMPTAANRRVRTEVQLNGRWSRSQIRTANSSGYFVIPLTYGVNEPGAYIYRVVASTAYGEIASEPFTITRVRPKIEYSITAATAGTKKIGETTNVWGTVKNLPNGTVWTEALVNGNWSRSQTRTSNSSGFYAIPLTYGINTPGTHTFRVGAATPDGTIYSQNVTITRTAPPTMEQEMLAAVNTRRAQGATCGSTYMTPTSPLKLDSRLNWAAQRHSSDMERNSFFDHVGSDGSEPWDRVEDTGYPWTSVGENIAWGHTSVEAVVTAWMGSAGHCRNIMGPQFRDLGIATARDVNGRLYWTQVFGSTE